MKKKCTKCGKTKKLSEFIKDRNRKDNLRSECSECSKDYIRSGGNRFDRFVTIERRKRKELFQKGLKKCSKCKKIKDIFEYSKNKINNYGLQSACIKCQNKLSIIRLRKKGIGFKKLKIIELLKNNKKRCPECKRIKNISGFHINKDNKCGLASSCKVCISKYNKKRWKIYYKKNKKMLIKAKLLWRKNNPEKNREIEKRYTRKRMKNDPRFKLVCQLRSRLYQAIKNNKKSKRTFELVGCELDYLMFHLQRQFKKGMTWDNNSFEGWHTDHIIACSRFDLSKPKEQEKCFHWTNLRPLWAKENMSKGDNLPKNLKLRRWTDKGWIFKWK